MGAFEESNVPGKGHVVYTISPNIVRLSAQTFETFVKTFSTIFSHEQFS